MELWAYFIGFAIGKKNCSERSKEGCTVKTYQFTFSFLRFNRVVLLYLD